MAVLDRFTVPVFMHVLCLNILKSGKCSFFKTLQRLFVVLER